MVKPGPLASVLAPLFQKLKSSREPSAGRTSVAVQNSAAMTQPLVSARDFVTDRYRRESTMDMDICQVDVVYLAY